MTLECPPNAQEDDQRTGNRVARAQLGTLAERDLRRADAAGVCVIGAGRRTYGTSRARLTSQSPTAHESYLRRSIHT